MKRSTLLLLVLFAAFCFPGQPETALADITWTGNVDPAYPPAWTTDTSGYVGYWDDASLTVDNDSDLLSNWGYIARNSGVTGHVTVTDPGSTWTLNSNLQVGRFGNGTLEILNGGSISGVRGNIGYGTDSIGEATVSGAGSTWTCSEGLEVGGGGNGTLAITEGGVVSSHGGDIGDDSIGEVEISGDGSMWTSSGDMVVGGSGQGTLTVTGGGLVSNVHNGMIGKESGSTGQVTLSGAGSTWTNSINLFVGGYLDSFGGGDGSGTLTIADEATVEVVHTTWMSYSESSSGTIALDSGGVLTTGSLALVSPAQLTGTGTIDTHGLVGNLDLTFDTPESLTRTLRFDSEPGQDIAVNLDMSDPAANLGALGAGYKGAGSLVIRDGTTVQSNSGCIGLKPGSTGTATVTGAGSTWINSNSLDIGDEGGTGSFTISDGGSIQNASGSVGYGSGAQGTVTVSGAGSTWTSSGNLYVGNGGGSGTLAIANGGTVVTGRGTLGNQDGSTGAATVSGLGSTWIINQYLRLGLSGSGSLTITNNGLVSVGEELTMDLNANGNSFVNMSTGGMLALFGQADDSLAGFLALVNGTDAIRYWDDSISDWADITGATLDTDYTLAYIEDTNSDLYGYTLLTVDPTLPGDANRDGAVDVIDLGILSTNYDTGGGHGWEHADFTGDGLVDVADLGILATNYGYGTTVASIPEPGAITLLICGLMSMTLLRWRVKYFAVLCFILLAVSATTQAETPVVEWTRQLGTSSWEYGWDVSVDDNGNAYVTGYTGGDLDGNTNAGESDIFLTKYDTSGTKLWARQLGTADRDHGFGVSVDGSGNAFVTGYTLGGLDGNTNAGSYDIFLTKYDTDGTKLWTRQPGTTSWEYGFGVSVDSSGNAYVTGYTEGDLDGNTTAGGKDMYLTKYDTFGNKLWTQQMGSSGREEGNSVSVDDNGNAYVAGYTDGDLDGNINVGESDIFLTKYDTDGAKLWTRQLGTTNWEYGKGVSVDSSGNAYVTGYTRGALDGNTNAGSGDMFLTKYDTDGSKLWTQQLGTAVYDEGNGVSVDGNGNAYVTGYTSGGLDGNTSAGDRDMFLTKYDTDGSKLWTRQMGTAGREEGFGVSVDVSGNAFVTGYTERDLDGNTSAGGDDIFLTKISAGPDPEPGDANRDGSVDVIDLGILATYYDTGGGHTWEHADFNGDGYVDVIDLGVLSTNYGNGSSAMASIPEPSMLACLLGLYLSVLLPRAHHKL